MTPALIAWVAFASLVGACSNSAPGRVSCVVKLGTEQTSVSLDAKVGDSVTATVGRYSVAFSFLDGLRLEAQVTDRDSTLMTATATGTTASGAAGTPDGQLEYSCAP
jgi:hypothetical protein